jgi:hypothetical protein
VEQARLLLDISVSSPPSQLSLKFVVAWLLRAVYLRCTARPHLSWMATCNAMHVAEAIGLHQEFGNMDDLRKRPREIAMKEAVTRRKTFWIAVSLNRLFSVEYGRSPVQLASISCSSLEKIEGDSDLTAHFVTLCQLLPRNNHDPRKLVEEKDDLAVALQRLADLSTPQPPFALLRAEICFCIFRKMRFLHLPLTRPQAEAVTSIIQAGLLEAQSLSSTLSKWWSVISVPFHSVGILIAIDTLGSLRLLANAMEALQSVVRGYDTHPAREALQTAEQLVRGCHAKKMKGASSVGQALDVVSNGKGEHEEERDVQPVQEMQLGFDWPSDNESG